MKKKHYRDLFEFSIFLETLGRLKVLCLQRIIFFKIPREGNIPLDSPPEGENFSRGIFG